MIKRDLPASLIIIAIFQFIAPLTLPPDLFSSISLPLWIIIAAVFALLGFNLLRLKDWARLATVFVQGFSIIVRLLTLVSNAVESPSGELATVYIITSILSIVLSALILYYIDQPDVQLIMQQ